MGLDFIRAAAKSFHKRLDQSRAELATPTLFTLDADRQPRTYAATARANSKLSVGEDLCVCFQHGRVVAQRGMEVVAVFESPPAEFIEALNASYGEAAGTVIEVHDIAATAEIAVC